MGANKGKTGVNQVDGADVGWIYDMTTGTIRADCKDDEVDHAGKRSTRIADRLLVRLSRLLAGSDCDVQDSVSTISSRLDLEESIAKARLSCVAGRA